MVFTGLKSEFSHHQKEMEVRFLYPEEAVKNFYLVDDQSQFVAE